MIGRLILGCDVLGNTDVESIAARPGDLRVVDPDTVRIRTLRDAGITAECADPGDPTQVEAGPTPGVVLVGSTDGERNLRALRSAREAYPDAHLIAYAPGDDVANGRLVELADQVIDAAEAVAGAVLTAGTGTSDAPFRELTQVLRGVSGQFGVFMHSDPDPDAIGSALALRDIARAQGVDAAAYHFGEIAHQENRALVNLLDLDLTGLDSAEFDPGVFAGIALVDHSRPGVNDDLPGDTPVDIVIDHHPPRGPVNATLLDVRTDVGATSTLLVDHLRGLDVDIDDRVATALLYGIRVDTRDFSRDITGTDFEAAAFLLSQADMGVLERVEQPSISGDTFDTIGRAIKNYEREGSIVISSAGRIAHRDAIAQAADRLLMIEDVTVAVVFGFTAGTAYVSGRTRGSDVDIGETMRHAFAGLGSAGGHTDMAGAQLRTDTLGSIAEDGRLTEGTVGGVITGRLFEELKIQWSPPHPGSDAPAGESSPRRPTNDR
jgi:nanoRNase/pAp phosphatase (c-di-AMP/oligoRNAs hydrolase)